MARVQVLDPATDQWVWVDTSDLESVNEAWAKSDALSGVHKTQEALTPPSVQRKKGIKTVLFFLGAWLLVTWR